MSKVLTPARRARLEKLAAYLEGLPADYRHFDMSDFLALSEGSGLDALQQYALRNGGVASCGTAACAIGHGPAAGILMPKEIAAETCPWSLWMHYSTLFIGCREHSKTKPPERVFEWLFGGDWESIDNSHYGAAARIRYFIENGVPADFDEDVASDEYAGGGWEDFIPLYAPYRIDAKAQADA